VTVTLSLLLPFTLMTGSAGSSPAAAPAPTTMVSSHAAPGDLLRRFAGVWDATMTMAGAPGEPSVILNGQEVNTVGGDGLFVAGDFRALLDGRPFQGHALLAWDAGAGKFRRAWADSTSQAFWISEGAWNPETLTLTMWIDTTDSEGHPARWREETIFKDDARTFTMYLPGSDKIEAAALTIAYHRRAGGEVPPPPAGPVMKAASDELAVIARSAGRWNARLEPRALKGAGGKGIEVNALCCDGRFLVMDYSGTLDRKPYVAHGLVGFNPATRQYEAAFIDSADRTLSRRTGVYDVKSGTLTLGLDAPGAGGAVVRFRQVETWSGPNERSTTYSVARPGEPEATLSVVHYKRAE
jgi:hypothetical protein